MLIILTIIILRLLTLIGESLFRYTTTKLEPLIECGLELLSETKLYIKHYRIVLFYLIFDLEVLLLLPTLSSNTNYIIFFIFVLLLIVSIVIEIRAQKK